MDKHSIALEAIDPGCPWQNGSNESFNGTFRKEKKKEEKRGQVV